jgi:heme/copper-type cytochrome/quinol oxidase subunit 1
VLASFLTRGGAPPSGWYAYSPLTSATYSPGTGADTWITGLALSGPGTILAGVNFVTIIMSRRAPGMSTFPMPIFTGTAANYAAFYHSRMLFKVKVVRLRQFQAYAAAQQAVQKSSGSTQ